MSEKEIVLASVSTGQPADLKFPLDFVREKIFICGVTGSGKSFTAGLLMEEINQVGLQFVCFDVLGAHGGLQQLPNVEGLEPKSGETVNIKGLVQRLKQEPTSFVVDISDLSVSKQQTLIAEYCDEMLTQKLNKGIMTFFEECQDFVPQRGQPLSFGSIVRMCKLGRQYGYGVCLISQRPASVSKDALSQCSVYLIHNLINHRDLKAVEDQMGFGTDREQLKKVLTDISAAAQGEVICYSPSYFRNEDFYRATKIKGERKVTHTGKNIEMKPATMKSETYSRSAPRMVDFDFDEREEEKPQDWEVLPPSRPSFTDSVKSDFASFYEERKPVVEIDMSRYESESESRSNGVRSPVMGIGMIAALAGGLYIVVKGFQE
jgi:hypothetical protein